MRVILVSWRHSCHSIGGTTHEKDTRLQNVTKACATKQQHVCMCVARCFLLVTSSQGMQVVTYEGQQVCTIKFPGKAVHTSQDLAIAASPTNPCTSPTAVFAILAILTDPAEGVTTTAEEAGQKPTAVPSVHDVFPAYMHTHGLARVSDGCRLHACRDAS